MINIKQLTSNLIYDVLYDPGILTVDETLEHTYFFSRTVFFEMRKYGYIHQMQLKSEDSKW